MATIQSVRDRAAAAAAEGNYEVSLSLVRQIRAYFPDDLETLGLLGRIQLEHGRYPEAREALEAVLEIDPERVLAHSALAMVAEEEGDLEEALARFELAFEIDNSNARVAEEIRRLRSQLGYTRPTDPGSSRHAMARLLLRRKEYGEAVPLFEDARRHAPGSAEVALGLAQALWLARRWREAEEVASEILVYRPHCLKALALVAGAAICREDEGALSWLSKTSRLNSGNSVARALFQGVAIPFPVMEENVEVPEGLPSQTDQESFAPSQSIGQPQGGEPEEEAGAEEEDPEAEQAREEIEEPLELPVAAEGEWVREKVGAEPTLAEYRRALRSDASLAEKISEAALALAEAEPGDLKARWLAGDALATAGQFRQAVEQYLIVLKRAR